LINLADHKDGARVLRKAVLDDVTPAKPGTVIEYWRGHTDTDPKGRRKDVFDEARRLSDMGRVILFQYCYGDFDYGYRAGVV
jgi:hypothetical protein